MFCVKCGNRTNTNVGFCGSCGAMIGHRTPSAGGFQPNGRSVLPGMLKNMSTQKLLMIGGGALAALVLSIVVIASVVGGGLNGTYVRSTGFSQSRGHTSEYYEFSGEEFRFGNISAGSKHAQIYGTYTINNDEILFLESNGREWGPHSFSQSGNIITIGGNSYIRE